jgi:hypothetical protein
MFDINTKEQLNTPGVYDAVEKDRINASTRGAASPDGAPSPPLPTDSNGDLNNARYDYGNDGSSIPLVLYAVVEWLPNPKSDLAGYHIELAGSPAGPWQRVTSSPIAWWETRYDARLWVRDNDGVYYNLSHDWIGPECAVFRVIAVDENGNESPPSDIIQIPPVADVEPTATCSAGPDPTIPAPHNVTAETPAEGTTHLTWDRDPAAFKYRVYTTKLQQWDQYVFYVTEETINGDPGCDGATCEFDFEGGRLSYSPGSRPANADDAGARFQTGPRPGTPSGRSRARGSRTERPKSPVAKASPENVRP